MRRKTEFWESKSLNNQAFNHYYNRLTELAISMFEWKNVPDTVDTRFLELALFAGGMVVFFKDDELGYLTLQCRISGELNVYRIPTTRIAYASNGYHNTLDETNSVIIFNNMLHHNSLDDVDYFARRMYECVRTIDVNVIAQKTPTMVLCDETQRLTMKNLYKQWVGNEPFIFGSKNIDLNGIKVLKTDAPFVGDKLSAIKYQVWNEAMSYLGIGNTTTEKKERMITDEVVANMGVTIASRFSRLSERQKACKAINNMFGLNMSVEYREGVEELAMSYIKDELGEPL